MKLSTLSLTTLTLIPSFISAAAIPEIAARNGTLAKRGGEVNYLANCMQNNVPAKTGYTVSYMVWYANVDNSLSGNDVSCFLSSSLGRAGGSDGHHTIKQLPDSLSNEYRDWSAGGELITG